MKVQRFHIILLTYLVLPLALSCGRADRPVENLLVTLGDLEIEGSLRVLSQNVALSHVGSVFFSPCAAERQELLPDVLSSWARGNPNMAFAIVLQEANHRGLFRSLEREALRRNWSMVPSEFSEVNSHGLLIVTSGEVLDYEFRPFSVDGEGYRRGLLSARIRVDGKVVTIINTQTASSTTAFLSDRHSTQLNEVLDFMSEIPLGELAVLGGNLNLGPGMNIQSPSEESSGDLSADVSGREPLNLSQIFEGWFLGRMSAWWNWSTGANFSSDDDIDWQATWHPGLNALARYPTAASRLWKRMRHQDGWVDVAAQRDHFFHTHSLSLEGIQTLGLPFEDGRCSLNAPRGQEVQGSKFLSDHFGLEAVYTFR